MCARVQAMAHVQVPAGYAGMPAADPQCTPAIIRQRTLPGPGGIYTIAGCALYYLCHSLSTPQGRRHPKVSIVYNHHRLQFPAANQLDRYIYS
jgi:hypothetical protein